MLYNFEYVLHITHKPEKIYRLDDQKKKNCVFTKFLTYGHFLYY